VGSDAFSNVNEMTVILELFFRTLGERMERLVVEMRKNELDLFVQKLEQIQEVRK
jgi:hypothetical protein